MLLCFTGWYSNLSKELAKGVSFSHPPHFWLGVGSKFLHPPSSFLSFASKKCHQAASFSTLWCCAAAFRASKLQSPTPKADRAYRSCFPTEVSSKTAHLLVSLTICSKICVSIWFNDLSLFQGSNKGSILTADSWAEAVWQRMQPGNCSINYCKATLVVRLLLFCSCL